MYIVNEKKIDKIWKKNGVPHREDGPAVIYENGDEAWYYNGRQHREDGPAVEWEDGVTKYWYYYDKWTDNEEKFYNERWRKEVLLDLV